MLHDLESKAKAATPGPWKCVAHVERLLLGVQSADGVPISVIAGDRPLTDMRQAIADNYYIAAACNSVPALIARIRELEELIDEICEYRNTVARFEPDTQEKLDAYERVRTQTAAEQ
jgi:hypothetical protein